VKHPNIPTKKLGAASPGLAWQQNTAKHYSPLLLQYCLQPLLHLRLPQQMHMPDFHGTNSRFGLWFPHTLPAVKGAMRVEVQHYLIIHLERKRNRAYTPSREQRTCSLSTSIIPKASINDLPNTASIRRIRTGVRAVTTSNYHVNIGLETRSLSEAAHVVLANFGGQAVAGALSVAASSGTGLLAGDAICVLAADAVDEFSGAFNDKTPIEIQLIALVVLG